jgi:hypothetical protein
VFNLINPKNMENNGLVALTNSELVSIEGGKPLSYYIGLCTGFITGTVVSFLAGLKDGLDEKPND